MMPLRRGIALVLSAPSGGGKSALAQDLLAAETAFTLSVSATTRARRAQERDGIHYRFMTQAEFDAQREAGGFLESAQVFGHAYGTLRAPLEEALAAGRDMLLDIDWQGAEQVVAQVPRDTVRVFLLPPSAKELARRLASRGTDTAAAQARRLSEASDDVLKSGVYDYTLINDDRAACLAELRAIVQAERLRRTRRPDVDAFVATLAQDLAPLRKG